MAEGWTTRTEANNDLPTSKSLSPHQVFGGVDSRRPLSRSIADTSAVHAELWGCGSTLGDQRCKWEKAG
jgi:hypothetical protein